MAKSNFNKVVFQLYWNRTSAWVFSLLNEKLEIYYNNQSFSRFGTHFDDMPKMFTYRQISQNVFLLTNFFTKIKVSQAQSTAQIFQILDSKS